MSDQITTERVCGFDSSWSPYKKTQRLLGQVNAVLNQYRMDLPLTVRQIFYRLVAAHGYPKTELAYGRLAKALVRARRARIVPMEAIRDDSFYTDYPPMAVDGAEGAIRYLKSTARSLRLDRQRGQERRIVIWTEARGVVPVVARAAEHYGIEVVSSGGFDSLTAKHAAGRDFGRRPTEVLHLGDYDPSGVVMYEALRDDVCAFATEYGHEPTFVRLAVTPEQVRDFQLPTAPPKRSGNSHAKSFAGEETVQLEAFAPDDLRQLVTDAIEARIDPDLFREVLEEEAAMRVEIAQRLDGEVAS